MPTILPLDQPPSTQADLHIAMGIQQGKTEINPAWTLKTHNGQSYAVFDDGSCVPVFKNKLGHIAGTMDGDGDIPWYPLGVMDTKPQWLNTLNVAPNGMGMSMVDPIRQDLVRLLDGMGDRVTVRALSARSPRNGTPRQPTVIITGLRNGLEAAISDAISQKLNVPRLCNTLTPGWTPGMPLVIGTDYFSISFSGKTGGSAHAHLQQLKAFIHA